MLMNENHSIATVKFKGNDVFFALGIIFVVGVMIISVSLSLEETKYGLVYSDLSELIVSQQSLKQQLTASILPENISCKNGMELIFKTSNSNPLCVKSETVEKLIERDWAHDV